MNPNYPNKLMRKFSIGILSFIFIIGFSFLLTTSLNNSFRSLEAMAMLTGIGGDYDYNQMQSGSNGGFPDPQDDGGPDMGPTSASANSNPTTPSDASEQMKNDLASGDDMSCLFCSPEEWNAEANRRANNNKSGGGSDTGTSPTNNSGTFNPASNGSGSSGVIDSINNHLNNNLPDTNNLDLGDVNVPGSFNDIGTEGSQIDLAQEDFGNDKTAVDTTITVGNDTYDVIANKSGTGNNAVYDVEIKSGDFSYHARFGSSGALEQQSFESTVNKNDIESVNIDDYFGDIDGDGNKDIQTSKDDFNDEAKEKVTLDKDGNVTSTEVTLTNGKDGEKDLSAYIYEGKNGEGEDIELMHIYRDVDNDGENYAPGMYPKELASDDQYKEGFMRNNTIDGTYFYKGIDFTTKDGKTYKGYARREKSQVGDKSVVYNYDDKGHPTGATLTDAEGNTTNLKYDPKTGKYSPEGSSKTLNPKTLELEEAGVPSARKQVIAQKIGQEQHVTGEEVNQALNNPNNWKPWKDGGVKVTIPSHYEKNLDLLGTGLGIHLKDDTFYFDKNNRLVKRTADLMEAGQPEKEGEEPPMGPKFGNLVAKYSDYSEDGSKRHETVNLTYGRTQEDAQGNKVTVNVKETQENDQSLMEIKKDGKVIGKEFIDTHSVITRNFDKGREEKIEAEIWRNEAGQLTKQHVTTHLRQPVMNGHNMPINKVEVETTYEYQQDGSVVVRRHREEKSDKVPKAVGTGFTTGIAYERDETKIYVQVEGKEELQRDKWVRKVQTWIGPTKEGGSPQRMGYQYEVSGKRNPKTGKIELVPSGYMWYGGLGQGQAHPISSAARLVQDNLGDYKLNKPFQQGVVSRPGGGGGGLTNTYGRGGPTQRGARGPMDASRVASNVKEKIKERQSEFENKPLDERLKAIGVDKDDIDKIKGFTKADAQRMALSKLGLSDDLIGKFFSFDTPEAQRAFLKGLGFSPEIIDFIMGLTADYAIKQYLIKEGFSPQAIDNFLNMNDEERREFLKSLGWDEDKINELLKLTKEDAIRDYLENVDRLTDEQREHFLSLTDPVEKLAFLTGLGLSDEQVEELMALTQEDAIKGYLEDKGLSKEDIEEVISLYTEGRYDAIIWLLSGILDITESEAKDMLHKMHELDNIDAIKHHLETIGLSEQQIEDYITLETDSEKEAYLTAAGLTKHDIETVLELEKEEEIREYLSNVSLFTQEEIDKIGDKYKTEAEIREYLSGIGLSEERARGEIMELDEKYAQVHYIMEEYGVPEWLARYALEPNDAREEINTIINKITKALEDMGVDENYLVGKKIRDKAEGFRERVISDRGEGGGISRIGGPSFSGPAADVENHIARYAANRNQGFGRSDITRELESPQPPDQEEQEREDVDERIDKIAGLIWDALIKGFETEAGKVYLTPDNAPVMATFLVESILKEAGYEELPGKDSETEAPPEPPVGEFERSYEGLDLSEFKSIQDIEDWAEEFKTYFKDKFEGEDWKEEYQRWVDRWKEWFLNRRHF